MNQHWKSVNRRRIVLVADLVACDFFFFFLALVLRMHVNRVSGILSGRPLPDSVPFVDFLEFAIVAGRERHAFPCFCVRPRNRGNYRVF